jgi:hypothetical protein
MRKVFTMTVACAILLMLTTAAHADVVLDPTGDFLSTLTPLAPRAGDLDVTRTSVMLMGTNLLFSATLNAPINTTPEAFYVWGVDRGAGATTANFASLGLPNIIFDAVVVIQNEGTGVVNDLTGVNPPAPLPGGNVTSSGNTINAIVPLSFLPTRGNAVAQYGWNLWPRWGGIAMSNAQISDFAPNDRNALVNVPEPSTVLLFSIGLMGVFAAARKRSKAA